jgi:CCR4-NOT transcription complex subunit 1
METLMAYVGELLKPLTIAGVSKSLYRGVLRILLVLHHDFPEFLAENHFRLCGVIPAHCTQLRNLVLSAFPSNFPELPDPFTAGLKVDRLVEIRTPPTVAGDVEGAIRRQNLKEVIDAALATPGGPTDEVIGSITKAIYNPPTKEIGVAFSPVNVDVALLNSLALYVGMKAINSVGKGGGPTFTQNSTHANLLLKLVLDLNPEARYYFLSAIANQLRYPNSHTHYFSYALLFLFGTDHNDQQESDVRQQITRVLLERLIVHRPHPWGLIITLLELLKNPSYMFWDLPFIKAAPEVRELTQNIITLSCTVITER